MSTPAQTIIIHYGEIGLKGKNRGSFLWQLKENINAVVQAINSKLSARIAQGYLFVELVDTNAEQIKKIAERLALTPGIVWFAVALDLRLKIKDLRLLKKEVIILANEEYKPGKTFCVRVHRSYKEFPFTSQELERSLGTIIIEKTQWSGVDLDTPDVTFYIDIYTEKIVFYTKKLPGPGGLPVGTADKVLCLLSGGIDSPVAAYLMAKRGCSVDFIHFTATPLQHKKSKEYKVSKLVEKLSLITQNSTLYLVPYTHFNIALLETKTDYELILFRRFMARVTEHIALQNHIQAMVTGDNLSQVASQTLPNLVSVSKAVQLPILRPLLGYDKNEIIKLAKKIDTYGLSIQPYKDCCSLITRHPKTRSVHEQLLKAEQKIFSNYRKLIELTLKDTIEMKYESFK